MATPTTTTVECSACLRTIAAADAWVTCDGQGDRVGTVVYCAADAATELEYATRAVTRREVRLWSVEAGPVTSAILAEHPTADEPAPERVDIPTLVAALERTINDGRAGRSMWQTDALAALATDRATIVRLALFIVSCLPTPGTDTTRAGALQTYDAVHSLADHLENVGLTDDATRARYHAGRVSP